MSILSKGSVEFELAGESVTLTPTVRAFDQLASGKTHATYHDVLAQLARGNLDMIKLVLRVGLGLRDDGVKELSEKIMLTGVIPVANACSDYVFRLFNGGRTVKDVQDEARRKRDEEEAGADADADPRNL